MKNLKPYVLSYFFGLLLPFVSFSQGEKLVASSHSSSYNTRIDSVVYAYNSDCLLIEEIRMRFETEWNNLSRISYEYDANNNLERRIKQLWSTSAWVNTWQDIYQYDANNNQIQRSRQNWWSNNWENTWQHVYEYDTNNNQTLFLLQAWDWQDTIWVNELQQIAEYDTSNNQLYELSQVWDTTVWINRLLHTYEYDLNNNRVYELWQKWEMDIWVTEGQQTSEYDLNNNLFYTLVQELDSSDWVNRQQSTYGYDFNHNLTYKLTREWDDFTASWVDYEANTYEYDNNDNVILYQYELHQYGETSVSTNRYYYEVTTNNEELIIPDYSFPIFPNPSDSYLTIDLASFEFQKGKIDIYNALGQLVYAQSIQDGEWQRLIDLSDWNEGTYFIQVSIGNQQKTQSFMIAR